MSNYTMSPVVNGEKKQMIVKVGDTQPIGTIVDYDGSTIPNGWEELEKNILWTNSSPTSDFAGQEITLNDDISNYIYYEVMFKFVKSANYTFSTGQIPTDLYAVLVVPYGNNYRRLITAVSNNKITFADGKFYQTYGGTEDTSNSNLIPIKIIGYKKQIKKIAPVTPANGNIENSYGTSQTDTYSQEYQNEHNVIVSSTQPTTSERVWFKQGKNLLNITNPIGSTADTFEILDNDWMHYVNSSGSTERVVFPKISVKPNTKYSIFVETKDVTGAPFVLLETYNNNTKIDTTYPNTSRVITTGSNINYLQFAITTSGMSTTGNYKIRIMVTKNTEIDTAYEPYIQKAININGEDEYYTNDYSTTEQVVGKWIDGKPLYRKCYEFTTLANAYNIESGKKQIISITGMIQRKDYTDIFIPVNGRANDTAWATSFGNIQLGSTNRILFNYGESWTSTSFNKLTIILEYTKTTD